MGYRTNNRRNSRRPRRHARRQDSEPRFIEPLSELVVELIVRSVRLLVGGVARLWRGVTNAPRVVEPRSPYLSKPRLPPRLPAASFATASHTTAPVAAPVPFERLPYRRAPGLLSKGERAVWYPLFRAVKGKYRIFCKVRLADVVCCPRDHRDERRWFRKIGRYHVDFVICEPRTTAPLLVVELDDRRHRERPRKDRDDFKDAALRAAGMPVYRIRAQQAYDSTELARNIERLINGQSL
jgi:hypothetical protein